MVVLMMLIAGSDPAAVAPPPKVKPKLICTREMPIGTKIPVRRCRTAEAVAREQRQGKEALEALQVPRVPTNSF